MTAEQRPADPAEIEARPAPRTMALSALWHEIEELIDLHDAAESGPLIQALLDRLGSIGRVLEDRLDPRYPDCPNCGESSLDYDAKGRLICWDCPASPEPVSQEYHRQHRRVWGLRGHGGQGR